MSPHHHHEVEHSYDPPPDAELPDLTALPGVHAVAAAYEDELEAVYFDTTDLTLVQAGISLRRRSGGADEGWHLKVPAGDGRDEVHVPLSRAKRRPPKELREAVRSWTLDEPMVPVATVRTRRTTHGLLAEDGTMLAEAVDDRVDAEVHLGSGRALRWREWEVELVEAGPALLTATDALMRDADAPPSTVSRKIARVLGDLLPPDRAVPRPRPKRPAHRALAARLTTQLAELQVRDCQARLGRPDGVHKTRVAMRRLRAALATYRPLLAADVTEPLREELRWAARSLGTARDLEVVEGLIDDVLAVEPADAWTAAARHRIRADLFEQRRAAADEVAATLSSERYLALLRGLHAVVTDPPRTVAAGKPLRTVGPRRVRRDWKRLARRLAAAEGLPPGEERTAALHRVRTAAKRVRYAAESLASAYGVDAGSFADHARRLQDALGDHHDAEVTRAWLRELVGDAGGDAFILGRLDAQLEQRAGALDQRAGEAATEMLRRKHRVWLG